MTGLPRKYAKMGFKAGWKAYKKNKGATPMVKRKRVSRRSYAKKTVARRSTKKMGIMSRLTNINMKPQLISAGYGVVRGQISRYNPLNRFFGRFGQYSDELSLYALAQGVKAVMPHFKTYAHKAQDIEAFLVGFQVSSDNDIFGKLFSGLSKDKKAEGGNNPVYG